ncbi:ER-derived vesicles protein erv46 [Malassezia nana]|uniref:ER-derived vesicles protein erv46 n=1 Tax=Malassezia nana TaxID=180528 RepID=A0AAF0J4L6_9BASI|nr:ER-derived vesicles protein erv46 [Malassezia nana]
MGPGSLFGPLRGLDAFGRTADDVRIRTNVGAFLTLLSALLIAVLVVTEYLDYRRVQTSPRLEVDLSRGEKLAVKLNITFPRVPCYLLSLDVVDVVGENQLDIHHDIERRRLDRSGKPISHEIEKALEGEAARIAAERGPDYCGDCYGGEAPDSGCCNSCEDVREAYARRNWSFATPDEIEQCRQEHWSEHIREQNHEGCNVAGEVHVNKVVGNFHLSPGRTFQHNSIHSHDLVPYLQGSGDEVHHFGHIIHEFSFGAVDEFAMSKTSRARRYGTLKERLNIKDALSNTRMHTEESSYMFQYFLKVVPVDVHRLNGYHAQTYQYSVTSYERDLGYDPTLRADHPGDGSGHVIKSVEGVPGVFFNYEISPLRVVQTEWRHSFWHLLSNLCALIGGIVTIAGLVDGLIYRSRRQWSGQTYNDDVDGLGMDAKLL